MSSVIPIIDPALVGLQASLSYFSASGTWTKRANAKLVEVILISGAGGGGSGEKQIALFVDGVAGATGGNGGIVSRCLFKASQLGATEVVTIGTGGAGGAAVTTDSTLGNEGVNGNGSYFGGTTVSNSKMAAVGDTLGTGGKKGIGSLGGGANSLVPTTPGQIVQFTSSQAGSSSTDPTTPNDQLSSYGPTAGAPGGGFNYVTGIPNPGGSIAGIQTRGSFYCIPPLVVNSNGGAINGGVAAPGVAASIDMSTLAIFGAGGDGSGASSVGNAAAGGAGSAPGGGGGGGGAGTNSVSNSGAGGRGADGGCYVITYY